MNTNNSKLSESSAQADQRERRRARDARYNRSEKGRARHRRYNHSRKGTDRYARYHDGGVGLEHRLAESLARRRRFLERNGRSTEGMTYVPDYNAVRKTEAMYALLRELGWDWQRSDRPGIAAEIGPVRPDAAPRKLVDEFMARWNTLDPTLFTRRSRS